MVAIWDGTKVVNNATCWSYMMVIVINGIYRTLSLVHLMAVPHRKNGFISRLLMFWLNTDIGSFFGARFESFDICLLLFRKLVVIDVTAYLVHTKSKYLIILFLNEMLFLLFPDILSSRFRPFDLFEIGLDLLLSRHHIRRLHSLMALSVFGEGNMLRLNVNNI